MSFVVLIAAVLVSTEGVSRAQSATDPYISAIPTGTAYALDPTIGPNGNVWFLSAYGKASELAPDGTLTTHAAPGGLLFLTLGPNGRLWYLSWDGGYIGYLTPETDTWEAWPVYLYHPTYFTLGSDGNMWFASFFGGPSPISSLSTAAGRISPDGVMQASRSCGVTGIAGLALGPDGEMWCTGHDLTPGVGHTDPANPAGSFFPIPSGGRAGPIALGPDGNMWFAERDEGRIGRIMPTGVVTEFSSGITADSGPGDLVKGPDGNMWFTEQSAERIGRITPAGVVTEFPTPAGFGRPGRISADDHNIYFDGLNAPGQLGVVSFGAPYHVATTTTTTMTDAGAVPYELPVPILVRPTFTG